MGKTNMKLNLGVASLLANAHSHSDYNGERFFFHGDLCQMYTALEIAVKLGIQTDIEGGLPFVMSQEDYDTVKQYLIEKRIDGWWHYVSQEEYKQLKRK